MRQWELLIVDNASRCPLASNWDVSWHPASRHILETKLGVSWARQRGIQEATADLIIFVDDDNLLDKTYLAEALNIKEKWPFLGGWGSGCIRGEFEVEPPVGLRSWLPVRDVAAPRWSNLAGVHSNLFGESPADAIPWGAGLCVRKAVATAYNQLCDQSSFPLVSRQGDVLLNGEDTEICFVCCRQGLGVGIFPELKITHLIPQRRVTEDYIVRFAEGICLSNMLLRYKWQDVHPQSLCSAKTLLSVVKALFLYRGVDRNMRLAWVRALAKANRTIEADLRRKRNRHSSDLPGVTVLEAIIGGDSAPSSQSAHLS
jgi:glycosyltransferase involved in cell wall biosynthesis